MNNFDKNSLITVLFDAMRNVLHLTRFDYIRTALCFLCSKNSHHTRKFKDSHYAEKHLIEADVT